MDDRDGSRIYRRSLTFLLVVAVHGAFPECAAPRRPFGHLRRLLLRGGGSAAVHARRSWQPSRRVCARSSRPTSRIGKERVPLAEAIELFRQRGDDENVRLLHLSAQGLPGALRLRGVRDYFHGYMAPSTGYLQHFALHLYPPGFILRFPPRASLELEPVVDYPKLIDVFREYGHTLRRVGHRRCRIARRGDPGRPHRGDHPGRRGAPRAAHRPDRDEIASAATRCGWC